ncbi:hypothetical protein [Cellulosilyticum ruminicola]|uniref:hypothetical protein n=1 Tax=Cellulosilyticum ruminicola TaxID=425254 RepID=UPI0006D28164|nr:hypothetical protein [Cellulosilyticum ruminicola]
MSNKLCKILDIYPRSFTANLYTNTHFRMISLIDARIQYSYGVEKVTLAYYSSSGTNNGKIKGLWYPIVGIKLYTGPFTEFTYAINQIVSHTTSSASASKGWLVKSLFFYKSTPNAIDGFASPYYHDALLGIGRTIKSLYASGEYTRLSTLTPRALNRSVLSSEIYPGNTRSQRENYENFIRDIMNS